MPWTKIHWPCKYKGETLPQVLFRDPSWFFYMIENRKFGDKGRIAEEARELEQKARNIRIPNNEGGNLVVEYTHQLSDYSFACLEIVPKTRELHSRSNRKDVIDLSYPGQYKSYDKLGYKLLLSKLKFILFGNSNCRMTKRRCETFFEDDNHFVTTHT
jgi:hypothetical protein